MSGGRAARVASTREGVKSGPYNFVYISLSHLHHVSAVCIDGDHIHDLLTLVFWQLRASDLNQLGQLFDLKIVVLDHGVLVSLAHVREGLLDLLAPVDLVHDQDELRGPVEQPLVTGLTGVVIHAVLEHKTKLIAHLGDDVVHVLLDLSRVWADWDQDHIGTLKKSTPSLMSSCSPPHSTAPFRSEAGASSRRGTRPRRKTPCPGPWDALRLAASRCPA